MLGVEKCHEDADEAAQQVVNLWGASSPTGDPALLPDGLKPLFDLACRYREAKSHSDNRRLLRTLTKLDQTRQQEARKLFMEAYTTAGKRTASTAS